MSTFSERCVRIKNKNIFHARPIHAASMKTLQFEIAINTLNYEPLLLAEFRGHSNFACVKITKRAGVGL